MSTTCGLTVMVTASKPIFSIEVNNSISFFNLMCFSFPYAGMIFKNRQTLKTINPTQGSPRAAAD
jgi:hypothetical protein